MYSIDISEPSDDFLVVAKRFPGRLFAKTANVTKEESVTNVLEAIVADAGALHGMVVNAGRTNHKAALDFSEEEIHALFDINVSDAVCKGPTLTVLSCLGHSSAPGLRHAHSSSSAFKAPSSSQHPWRPIGQTRLVKIQISCDTHTDGAQRVPSAPYGASKAGVRNMTHTLAMEWAKYGIRVNSVSPGLVETAMTYWVPQQPDWEQQLKYYGGLPRLAQVQELGGAYVYLLSNAASYTTSIDIPVNGVIGSKYPQHSTVF